MSDIKIEVEDLKAKLKELSSATQEFSNSMQQFQSNTNGCCDGMNSDFIGIAKKMLAEINDGFLKDISESLDDYCNGVNSVVTEFENTDDTLANDVMNYKPDNDTLKVYKS